MGRRGEEGGGKRTVDQCGRQKKGEELWSGLNGATRSERMESRRRC